MLGYSALQSYSCPLNVFPFLSSLFKCVLCATFHCLLPQLDTPIIMFHSGHGVFRVMCRTSFSTSNNNFHVGKKKSSVITLFHLALSSKYILSNIAQSLLHSGCFFTRYKINVCFSADLTTWAVELCNSSRVIMGFLTAYLINPLFVTFSLDLWLGLYRLIVCAILF